MDDTNLIVYCFIYAIGRKKHTLVPSTITKTLRWKNKDVKCVNICRQFNVYVFVDLKKKIYIYIIT